MTTAAPQDTAADPHVIYVYGVARAPHGQMSALPRIEGIVPGAPVVPLVHADLMAFVSAVPSAQFGAREFASAVNDTDWLRDRILVHEKVLEALRSSYDVVPFRFGTIYLQSERAANALARHHAALCEALDRIRDASEWGLKLFCDRDALRCRIETESDALRELRNALAHASKGARFFLQKRYVKALEGETAATVASSVERIRQRLDRCACESALIGLQPAAAHGRSADMVMNAAYLVAQDSLGRFRQAITALQEEFADRGYDFELTGPWPPYHFVATWQEGKSDGAAPDR